MGELVKVHPLYALYCRDCVESLTRYRLKPGSIIPMCKECFQRFIRNGDYERACALANPLSEKP